jgi:hypothetical protein
VATAGSGYQANDASAQTDEGQAAERPPTDAELAYLDARAEETAAAVKKIRGQIKASERSLKTAEQMAEDAVKAREAGRDLPDVQRRRAR